MATETLTISPITRTEAGAYTFTVNGREYWTNEHGQGLFTSTYHETKDYQGNTWMDGEHNKQITGTAQFDLGNCSVATRRARVISYFAQGTESYEPWLTAQGERHSQRNAASFYQHLAEHTPAQSCCQVVTDEEMAEYYRQLEENNGTAA